MLTVKPILMKSLANCPVIVIYGPGQTRGPGLMTAISTFGYYTFVTFGHLCSVTIFVFLVRLVKSPLLKKKYSMFGITV